MANNFEVPEIEITPFAGQNTVGGSTGNELPFIPFSNKNEDELDLVLF